MDTPTATATPTPTATAAKPAARDLHHLYPLYPLYPRTPAERFAWIEANRALVPFALAPLMARYPGLSDADRDDVTAAGLRALCEAVDKYEPGRGAKLSSYAIWLIQFAGRKALAKCGDWKAKRAGFFVASLDEPATDADGATARLDLLADEGAAASFAELLDHADGQEKAALLWEWIRANVTPRQLRALRLAFVDGKTPSEAAEEMGKSRQCVNERVQSGLAKLQKAAGTKSGRQMARRLFHASMEAFGAE